MLLLKRLLLLYLWVPSKMTRPFFMFSRVYVQIRGLQQTTGVQKRKKIFLRAHLPHKVFLVLWGPPNMKILRIFIMLCQTFFRRNQFFFMEIEHGKNGQKVVIDD